MQQGTIHAKSLETSAHLTAATIKEQSAYIKLLELALWDLKNLAIGAMLDDDMTKSDLIETMLQRISRIEEL